MSLRKRQRVGSSGCISSPDDDESSSGSTPLFRRPATIPGVFNDPANADIIVCIQLEGAGSGKGPDCLKLYDLHLRSDALRRSRYFSTLLSERWQPPEPQPSKRAGKDASLRSLSVNISAERDNDILRRRFDAYVVVLRLLHTLDFSGAIRSVSDALDLIPVALALLFDECVQACIQFLDAVPWNEDEEEGVLSVIPLLSREESQDLIARVSPPPPTEVASGDAKSTPEEMLHRLLETAATRTHPNAANVKAFVAKLLRDYPSRETVQKVLDRAFMSSLEMVKDLLGKYARPDLRVAGDNDEREAMQRLNLHAAMVNAKQLHWLVERMIEMKVVDNAVREWSEQAVLAADLQKAFRDEGWPNFAPGLPLLITRCTFRLATAVASGATLAPREVRMKLVRDWLPVLNVCKDIVSPLPSGHRTIHHDLEETFLKIISTLPLSDAQELLQQCLSFSTRNFDDCPHLISAFQTWFRRSNRLPIDDMATID